LKAKRVAVIGAGPSGLVAVKELLEQGHRVTCFEKADSLGGVFRFDENDGLVWATCRLTSSGTLTAWSDFPVSAGHEEHMPVDDYVRYLSDYCTAFGVHEHIRYRSRVEKVRRLPGGGWAVSWSHGGPTSSESFDAVAVCSGLHQYPHVPRYPGQESYPGETMHAWQYRRGDVARGKKVLIIGAGESGADIAAEVAKYASETVVSLRRGVAVVPRCTFGRPRDYLTSRIINSSAHWLFQTRNPQDDHKRTVYRYAFLPFVFVDKCLQIFFHLLWQIFPLFLSTSLDRIRVNIATQKLKRQLLAESGGTLSEQFGTKDEDFVRAMAAGKCRRVPGIKRFDGPRVDFADDSSFEPDLVLLCTGFETRIPFLDEKIASEKRYMNTFAPEVGDSLGFIGFLRPAFGAIPPLAELQARWFALLQGGELQLPSPEAMKTSIKQREIAHGKLFRPVHDRLGHLVDHTEFCDELAEQIGCKPRQSDLRKESRAFRFRFHAGPFVAAQYRLTGPGAKPELARRVIEGLPVAHPWPQLANLYLRRTLCRILYRLLGQEYRPKLVID